MFFIIVQLNDDRYKFFLLDFAVYFWRYDYNFISYTASSEICFFSVGFIADDKYSINLVIRNTLFHEGVRLYEIKILCILPNIAYIICFLSYDYTNCEVLPPLCSAIALLRAVLLMPVIDVACWRE